uniref:Uncharacterized protein n=1 Tax=Oryza nivara TaxID=4536 RepID=A0A0E0ITL5_ORYNI
MSNEVDEPKIMLVGKGSRKSLFSFVPLSKWLQEASNQDTVSRHKDGLLQALPWVESGEHEEKDCLFNPCTGYRMIYWNRHKELLQLQLHPMWKAPISCCEQEGNPFAIDNKNVGLAFSQIFDVIPCPSCIAMWDNESRCHAFVVELQRMLCVVLSDPVADELDIWKWDHGLWTRAYTINLKLWPDFSLATNVVVPLAVDPIDGRVLLNTGRKLGLYNPFNQAIENLYALDQASLMTSKVQRRCPGVRQKCITRCGDVPSKFSSLKLSMAPCDNIASPSSASSRNKELNYVSPKIMPVVTMLYEETLAYYPQVGRARGVDLGSVL